LNNITIEVLCTAWHKALRRFRKLPYNSHSYFLPILSCSIPLFDEIIKRSARFIIASLFSTSCLVRSVSCYSILYAKYASVLGVNVLFYCPRYNWTIDSFLTRSIPLSNNLFTQQLRINLTDFELNSAISLTEMEVMLIRERHLTFPDSLFCLCTIN